jgi:hypothetical protein
VSKPRVVKATGQPAPTLRWKIVWRSSDGRGCVQRYLPFAGGPMFDAYLDGHHLGHTRKLGLARRLVKNALVAR